MIDVLVLLVDLTFLFCSVVLFVCSFYWMKVKWNELIEMRWIIWNFFVSLFCWLTSPIWAIDQIAEGIAKSHNKTETEGNSHTKSKHRKQINNTVYDVIVQVCIRFSCLICCIIVVFVFFYSNCGVFFCLPTAAMNNGNPFLLFILNLVWRKSR